MAKKTAVGPAQERAWRALLRGHALLVNKLDAELREHADMSFVDYDVLVQLSEAPENRLAMAELARALVYSRSGLTRLVDSLEERGFVVRERSATDRRSWYAVLTADGLAALKSAWTVHVAGVGRHFAAHTSAAQARTLIDVFDAVIADLTPEGDELRVVHPRTGQGR
jgi:DNA-binding MarR family transcriptional regulator